MIFKLLDPKSPLRPSLQCKEAVENWRKSILSDIKSKVSQKTFDKIEEKFLKPQNWYGTVKAGASSNINAEDEVSIEGYANGVDPDRAREVILSNAWKTENFDLNPIILFNHNYNWPIGSCVEYAVKDQGLYYKAVIGKPSAYPCLTDVQIMCRSLLAQGILRASSVGFIPFNMDYDEENDILRYTEVELLEISLVSVPMQQCSLLDSVGSTAANTEKTINPNIGREKQMDKAQYDEFKALLEKIAGICDQLNKPKDPPPAGTEGDKEEMKSIKGKLADLQKAFDELKAEKEEMEKSVEGLLVELKKHGFEI